MVQQADEGRSAATEANPNGLGLRWRPAPRGGTQVGSRSFDASLLTAWSSLRAYSAFKGAGENPGAAMMMKCVMNIGFSWWVGVSWFLVVFVVDDAGVSFPVREGSPHAFAIIKRFCLFGSIS